MRTLLRLTYIVLLIPWVGQYSTQLRPDTDY